MSKTFFDNIIIYLIGFSGTGKLTIAREIARLSGARIVDNHLINNPVFSLISLDSKTPLPDSVWQKVWAIRHIVLQVIEEISPHDFSFIFTNELVEGSEGDKKLFKEIEELAIKRRAIFLPVRLLCKEEELCRRVISTERKNSLKDTSIENARKKSRNQTILQPNHPNTLSLDVSDLIPLQAAQLILEKAVNIG